MKYVLLFGGTMEGIDQLEGGARGEAMADYEKSGQWFEKYTKAGKVVGGEELQGPSSATTVSRKNGKIVVTDGPFIESKEVIGGFALIEVSEVHGRRLAGAAIDALGALGKEARPALPVLEAIAKSSPDARLRDSAKAAGDRIRAVAPVERPVTLGHQRPGPRVRHGATGQELYGWI